MPRCNRARTNTLEENDMIERTLHQALDPLFHMAGFYYGMIESLGRGIGVL